MTNIFTLENNVDFSEKLNIDDLYEKKKQYDLNKLALYNKILNRIHVRIKTTSKQRIDEQFCWFLVPEIIIGVPKFNQADCIAYILEKLKENGFQVKYVHPNTIFICWKNWVPSYVRSEIKKKTGVILDEYGNVNGTKEGINNEPKNMDEAIFKTSNNNNNSTNNNAQMKKQSTQNKYTPINSYKPHGKLIYDDDLLNL